MQVLRLEGERFVVSRMYRDGEAIVLMDVLLGNIVMKQVRSPEGDRTPDGFSEVQSGATYRVHHDMGIRWSEEAVDLSGVDPQRRGADSWGSNAAGRSCRAQ